MFMNKKMIVFIILLFIILISCASKSDKNYALHLGKRIDLALSTNNTLNRYFEFELDKNEFLMVEDLQYVFKNATSLSFEDSVSIFDLFTTKVKPEIINVVETTNGTVVLLIDKYPQMIQNNRIPVMIPLFMP